MRINDQVTQTFDLRYVEKKGRTGTNRLSSHHSNASETSK